MKLPRSRRWMILALKPNQYLFCRLVLLLGMLCGVVGSTSAQDVGEGASNEETESSLEIGIGGHYRVGHLTAVRARGEIRKALVDSADAVIETVDGDGVRVQFDVFPGFEQNEISEIGYVTPGAQASPLVIRNRDTELVSTRFPLEGNPAQGPAMIPASQPWVLSIGDPLGVDEIGKSNVLLDKAARFAVTMVKSSSMLPHHAWGYDGVDLIMINSDGADVLEDLSGAQQSALTDWVKRGGRVMICLGAWTRDVKARIPWILQLLPASEFKVARYDPAAFETYTASQTPLERFDGVRLPRGKGTPVLMGRTTRRVSAVLACDYVCGLGRCTVITADLNTEPFASWPERLNLLTQVMGDFFDDPDESLEREGAVSFNDLAGQMRGALDQFSVKPQFSFSTLSLILMILIALLGPLDYLLINRLLGKPLLGWISFPAFAIALSAFLISQSSPRLSTQDSNANVKTIRANQFQVIDLDLVQGAGRGLAWSYLYSHDPVQLSASWELNPELDALLADPAEMDQLVYPMGYPGKSFGGIQLAGENQTLGAYQISLRSDISPGGDLATVENLTIAPRSSRSVACELGMVAAKLDESKGLVRSPNSMKLKGSFTNVLPIDILDGQLVFGNRVYLLPTRVPAGSTIPSVTDLRQKNFRWKLTRQQSYEKNVTESNPWQPTDFSEPVRIAEMLMFHRAAGGSIYTELVHRPLGDLDLSEILDEDRCILVGRTQKPLLDLAATVSGDESSLKLDGNIVSLIRVILPVRSTLLD
ncbi:MAG: hypothetical protein AAF802_16610 [Planctomycetota bacterium]